MDYKRIEDLLENYWNGVSSLEQERELVAFFTKEEVPAHLEEYQSLFQFFQEEKDKEVSTSFENNLIAALEKEAQQEEQIAVPAAKVKRLWTPLLRIAASVALVCGLFFMYQNHELDQPDEFAIVDSFDTPEEAYRETMKALKLVSRKMNKGTKTTIMAVPSAGYMTKIVGKKKRK